VTHHRLVWCCLSIHPQSLSLPSLCWCVRFFSSLFEKAVNLTILVLYFTRLLEYITLLHFIWCRKQASKQENSSTAMATAASCQGGQSPHSTPRWLLRCQALNQEAALFIVHPLFPRGNRFRQMTRPLRRSSIVPDPIADALSLARSHVC
jgi:hypothetical protein